MIVTPLVRDARVSTLTAVPSANPESNQDLARMIEDALGGSTGEYAVVVKNLTTGEKYTRQSDKNFEPASLYKLWVMATVFEQIANGKLVPDQVLSASVSELNSIFKISSDEAELTEGSISLTVSEAVEKMITISHNYAALLLVQKVRFTTVREFLKTAGLIHSNVGNDNPVTTASDIGLFLEMLATGKLVSQTASGQMLTLLQKQELKHKLPKYLPNSVKIAHKTGELGRFTHDVGIVFLQDSKYIIVILSESDDPAGAEDRIARLSELVYKHFNFRSQ